VLVFAAFVLPAGLAFVFAAAELVVVVVELVTVVELPFAAVLVVLVVFVVVVVFAFVVALAFVFAGLLAALLAGAASPQAIPRALRPRTVESTITFFISRSSLLSSSKLSLPESYWKPSFFDFCPYFQAFFRASDNTRDWKAFSQPKNAQKQTIFLSFQPPNCSRFCLFSSHDV